jgi:hypothetical protein
LRRYATESGTPDCAERDRLVDDVALLAGLFAALMEAPGCGCGSTW